MNEMTRPIEVITSEIKFYTQQAGMSIIEIGKRLHEAKLCLPHGEWGNWLRNEVQFSERTAQNFMRIAKEYQNPQLLADMGNSATKALLLLSVPAEDREEFVGEAHEINGERKTVAEMTTKEMEELTRELAAERAEKEKLQSQLNLFQDEAQKEKDAALDAVYEETEGKLEILVAQREAAEKARREAEAKIASMETEMDELRMQAEQTALPNETELEKARAEAETRVMHEMSQKLDKAKADAEKYKKEAAEAERAIEAHEQAQKEAEAAALQAKEELARVKAETEKKLKTSGSSVVAVFKVHFEAVQTEMDKMKECIRQAEDAGQTDDAAKLRMALKALCSKALDDLGEGEVK